MRRRDYGFTILELMAAMTISLAVTGIALFAFNRLERYRSIQDKQLRYAEEAQAFFSILQRELTSCYSYGGGAGLSTFEVTTTGIPPNEQQQIKFTAAVDTFPADHAQITYYVDSAGLHREIMWPYTPPASGSNLFAPDIKRFNVVTLPGPGVIPLQVLVTIELPDPSEPDNPQVNKQWSHWIRIENAAP